MISFCVNPARNTSKITPVAHLRGGPSRRPTPRHGTPTLYPTARRLAYTVADGPLGSTHYNGAAQVVDDGGRTRFVWVADVLPDALTDALGPLMDRGIQAIKATLERGRSV